MATGIGYVHETWNPIVGCSPASPGCEHCYARVMHRRLHAMGATGYERPFEEVHINQRALDRLTHWRKPRRILCCSMSDLFHPDVPFSYLLEVFQAHMNGNLRHAMLYLTKRPERMVEFIREIVADPWMQDRVRYPWLGATVENQEWLDRRLPAIQEIAQVWPGPLWLSCEPLLGPLDLSGWLKVTERATGRYVVVGPETGPGKRYCARGWIEDIGKQCQRGGVPHYVKGVCDEARKWLRWNFRQDLVPLPGERRNGEEVT